MIYSIQQALSGDYFLGLFSTTTTSQRQIIAALWAWDKTLEVAGGPGQ
jgi:hypothetical protein